MTSIGSSSAELNAALLGFNQEAVVYCQGISNPKAHEYAMDYARMLRSRANGVESGELLRFPFGLFEPDRHLIKAMLEKMFRKHFPVPRVASKLP